MNIQKRARKDDKIIWFVRRYLIGRKERKITNDRFHKCVQSFRI